MLERLPRFTSERLLVDASTLDDAAVYDLGNDVAIVQTLDFFTPVVDDPYTFGQIAAANSLSDIYAMGATPLFALNVVGFPMNKLPSEVLTDILCGGADKAREAGIAIAGGHSTTDAEPRYGLVVTGQVHPDRIVRNAGALPGDKLLLTKPLGSGILAGGIKSGRTAPETIDKISAIMAALNRAAAEAMMEVGVNAGTDVTGFGLLGHLFEMMTASGTTARIVVEDVPVLPEVWPMAEAGAVPGGTRRNLEYLGELLRWSGEFSEAQKLALGDAQTSGGLLMSVAPDRVADLLSALAAHGVETRAVIGEVIEKRGWIVETV